MLAEVVTIGMIVVSSFAVDCGVKVHKNIGYNSCEDVIAKYDIKYEYPSGDRR